MNKYEGKTTRLKIESEKRQVVKKETTMINIKLIPKDFNPIPIKKNSKIPIIKWKRYITEVFPHERLKNHDGNVGIHCGKISNNLLILDWDFKEDHKYFFETLYQEFSEKFPDLTDTYIVETPHGFHFYYRMVDFLEKRSENKNDLFTHSKKLNKDIFKGTIKTKYYEHLKGWDVLGQGGYILLPPSQLYEIEYVNQNGVRVIEYEFKIDKKDVKEIVKKTLLKYMAYNNKKIKTINSKQLKQVKEFFLLDKIKKPRKPFIDLMNGVIDIETYAIETGQKEFIYWKNLFREMWHYCGMKPYEVYRFLEMNQDAFDKDKCDVQLPHHPYTVNPSTTEKMIEYFPDYYINKTVIKNTEIVLKDLNPKIIFNKDKILQTIEEIPSDMTDDKSLINLFIQIPSSESGFLNKVKSILSKQLEYYSKPDLNKLIKKYMVDVGNIRAVEVREGEYSIEDFNGFAESDDFNLGNIIQIIKYEGEYILESDNGITLYNKSAEFKQVLFKSMKILSKVIDVNRTNIELFTLEIDGYMFRNRTKNEIFKQLKPDIQHYNKFGLDVIKRFLTYYSEIITERTPEYITGWNDGWKLPFNEIEKGFTIINHTEIQEIVYQNIKNKSYQSYSNEEKEAIKQEMKDFFSITQLDEDKLSMIIGWSISAPFKLYFIENFNLFTYMYLCGFKGTGKSKIGDFFITNLYKHIDDHLSSGVLKSTSQFEDYSASTTFPFNVQEVDQSIKPEIVGYMKDMATSKSNMIRKNTDNTIKINKLKVCSMMLDGNEAVQVFLDEAWNSKMLFLNFEKDEMIVENKEWMDLFQSLKKKKLFSFIYDYTKDWTNKNIEKRIEKIDKEYTEILEDLTYEDVRLAKTYRFLMFGIELFEEVFGVELSKDFIYDLLIEGRTQMSSNLMDSFKAYIVEAIELNRLENNTEDRLRNLPSYLKHGISKNNKKEYLFLKTHLRDFEQFDKNQYNNLKKLYNLLSETLEDKDLLGYDSKYINEEKRSMRCITFKQTFLKT